MKPRASPAAGPVEAGAGRALAPPPTSAAAARASSSTFMLFEKITWVGVMA